MSKVPLAVGTEAAIVAATGTGTIPASRFRIHRCRSASSSCMLLFPHLPVRWWPNQSPPGHRAPRASSDTAANKVCTFYQKGACSYGSRCRYDHVKVSRNPTVPPPPPTSSAARRVTSTSLQLLSSSQPHTGHQTDSSNQRHQISVDVLAHSASKPAWRNDFQHDIVSDDGIDWSSNRNLLNQTSLKPADLPICSFAAALRACPICRKLSYYVIPSVLWYFSKEEKEEITESYKSKLKSIDCKYFDFGTGSCPFGTSCFYRHAYRDGRLEEVVLWHLDADDGSTVIAKDIRLSDFLIWMHL
ncbi:unnamed protein product [Miscanthus lutarioriparius]|uniref:C3H1-type domain-containing protein n=1 Tax=Miscanthus lutarioriparius TaxID=422564 RepID=A0A811SF68_9POAL|nr:unnamed protein product [Miscanthus lutarioriparius]